MRVHLDPEVRVLAGGRTLIGGEPMRVMRLSAAGAEVARTGTAVSGSAAAALLSRLVDAGLAHPEPTPVATRDVAIVIPVRERPELLERCLDHLVRSVGAVPVTVVVVDDGSRQSEAIAAVCECFGSRLVRRKVSGGPAAARNAGLSVSDSRLVAFLDSDCEPEPGWLELLCGVMEDPRVGAAAPRILPLGAGVSTVQRYAAARSPLDMGQRPGWVRPGGRIAYVPTAALLVRRDALGGHFDADLRYGEDVDLVWRMHDAGWRVRYEPAAIVGHREPGRLRPLLARRFRYGTSAGPLARRHPGRLAPLVIHPRPMATAALMLSGRPLPAVAALSRYALLTLSPLTRAGVPSTTAGLLAARSLADSTTALGRSLTMLAPWLLAAGLARRRLTPGAVALLAAEPLSSWLKAAPPVDPMRWSALVIADDVAYGAGVWAGALSSRTLAPLLPGLRRLGEPPSISRST